MSADQLSLQSGCHAFEEGILNQYDYVPSLAAGVTFVALFGVTCALHVIQATWTRMWWGYVFAIGAITEVIGWGGRTWSAICPYNNDAFLMQISTLIIAPTFFTAGIYIVLGRLITLKGPHTSPIPAKWYLWIFCTCDVISLVLQAVGGGLASNAASTPDGDTKLGTDIMVAGILFQMAAIAVFTVLAVIFLLRVYRTPKQDPRDKVFPRNLQLLVGATSLSVVAIFVRSVYRCIELLQGWTGYLITHEEYFIALDGALMVLAVAVFNVFYPAWLMDGERDADRGESLQGFRLEETLSRKSNRMAADE